MKKTFIFFAILLFICSIGFPDFTNLRSIDLQPNVLPTGVAINPSNSYWWFSNNYYLYSISQWDEYFRFQGTYIPGSDRLFKDITFDTINDSLWIVDGSSTIREFTQDGDCMTSFIAQNIYPISVSNITYDSSHDSLWITYGYFSDLLYEFTKQGNYIRTLRLDNLTTQVWANDIAYDSNHDVLWIFENRWSNKLVKLSKDGTILKMIDWDLSQIRVVSGFGYNPLTDRILVVGESAGIYNDYYGLWEYSTEGILQDNHLLDPYGFYSKGLSVSNGSLWIISVLWDNRTSFGITQSDMTGRYSFFISIYEIFWGIPTGVIEDKTHNCLWMIGNPFFPDTYSNVIRLSYTGEIIDQYFCMPGNEMQGIAQDSILGHLWLADSTADSVVELTTSGTLVGSFPIGQTGCAEPRGITYDPTTDRLMVIDDATDCVYSFTRNGEYKGGCSIAHITTSPEDISYEAPGVFWILEPQRAFRCYYESPNAAHPALWTMFR